MKTRKVAAQPKRRAGGAAGVNEARRDYITALEGVLACAEKAAALADQAHTQVRFAAATSADNAAKAIRDAAWVICGTLLLVGAAVTIAIAGQ